MSYAICTSEGRAPAHSPLQLIASALTFLEDGDILGSEIGIIAEQYHGRYELSNRYADGIIGVSKLDLELASEDEQPLCADCHCLIDHWEHN